MRIGGSQLLRVSFPALDDLSRYVSEGGGGMVFMSDGRGIYGL